MLLRSATRQALDALREREDAVYRGRLSVDTLSGVAAELYAVADLLVGQPRLRRTLGDPATKPEGRADLIGRLLQGQVGEQALELVRTAAAQRWSSPWDLADALESAGDDALFAAAEQDASLDRVEDELFRFERIIENEGEVAGLLDELTVEPARRNELLDALVEGKVSPITLALLHHAVASQRKRSITFALDDLLEKAAARRHRSIARVVSAVPLSDAQQRRLVDTLTALYDRPISVRIALDPKLQGGLIVRVGDEVIDGSIATRFADARAAFAD